MRLKGRADLVLHQRDVDGGRERRSARTFVARKRRRLRRGGHLSVARRREWRNVAAELRSCRHLDVGRGIKVVPAMKDTIFYQAINFFVQLGFSASNGQKVQLKTDLFSDTQKYLYTREMV